jgi:hypothetical protein
MVFHLLSRGIFLGLPLSAGRDLDWGGGGGGAGGGGGGAPPPPPPPHPPKSCLFPVINGRAMFLYLLTVGLSFNTIVNPVRRRWLRKIKKGVFEGLDWSENCLASRLFDKSNMIRSEFM